MTSSARSMIDGGTARPSALAVFRFTTISNFVGNCTGRAGALVIGPDAFFLSRREQLAALTLRHAVPAINQYREFAAAGAFSACSTDQEWHAPFPVAQRGMKRLAHDRHHA